MAKVVVDKVDKIYENGFKAVKKNSFIAEDKEFVILVGPSGCGKAKMLEHQGSIPIGWLENQEYNQNDENVIPFAKNKAYLMFTDGIFECENKEGKQLGMKGFTKFLEDFADLQCGLMLPHRFKQILKNKDYDISSDDFTLVEFQRMPVNRKSTFYKFYEIKSLLQNTGPIGKECFQNTNKYLNDNELAMKCEFVINEFLNNIIEHGLESRKDTSVAFRFEIDKDIILTFWDTGVNWSIPAAQDGSIAELGKERGMGLQIIHSLADSFTKQRIDKINETIIVLGNTDEKN